VVKLLLDRGAEVSAKSRHRMTPLQVAEEAGCEENVALLKSFQQKTD